MAFQLKDIGGKNQFVEHLLVRRNLFSSSTQLTRPSAQEIFALFMFTGIFSTLLIPETAVRFFLLSFFFPSTSIRSATDVSSCTQGKSLEELSGEDQENFIAG